jgi:hypothetical protein
MANFGDPVMPEKTCAALPGYEEDLVKDLKNPRHALDYLTAAFKESPEALTVALRDVFKAQSEAKAVAADRHACAGTARDRVVLRLARYQGYDLWNLETDRGTLVLVDANYCPYCGVKLNR